MSKYKFDHFGVMIDCSRNAVMSPEGLRRFLPLLKKMGYNTVMLYTEDTYEVNGEPYFGYMRGRYSVEEMKQIDAYARSLGIEMIPCIQTLAHLNATLRWGKIPVDTGDIMLTDDPRTYELIDRMFSTLSDCFQSRNIHIGMDEAHMLGRGKHLDLHGFETANDCIRRHLAKVCQIADKYGYKPQIWSDMFFRPWNNGGYYCPEQKVPKEVIDAVPENVTLAYWDYYHKNYADYEGMIKNHKQFRSPVWFAGGAWTWMGVTPLNGYSLATMVPAIDACKAHKIRNVYFTMWGDNGGECSRFAVLPALFYLSQYAHGNTDENVIKEKFRRLTGIAFDEFMQLDLPNALPASAEHANPSKYMFMSDIFNDFLDYTVCPGGGKQYAQWAQILAKTAKKSRTYGYLFDTQAKLCAVLANKYELGLRTRRAYEAGDKDELRRLAENEFVAVEKAIPVFRDALEKQWFKENKPCGFDVQDLRVGGVLQRIRSTRKRILDYVNGKIDRIQELDEPLLPFGKEEGKAIGMNSSSRYTTTNVY